MSCFACAIIFSLCYGIQPDSSKKISNRIVCQATKGKLEIFIGGKNRREKKSEMKKDEFHDDWGIKEPIALHLQIDYHKHTIASFGIQKENAHIITTIGVIILTASYLAVPLGILLTELVLYPFTLMLGEVANKNNLLSLSGLVMFIPVIGPFIALGYVSGITGIFSMSALIIGGVFQLVGLGMLIGGLVKRSTILAQEQKYLEKRKKITWRLLPWVNHQGMGMSLVGQF